MDTGDSVRSSDSICGSLIGNGLTSDVLRARAKQYYNNCHPHVPRPSFKSNAIHKCGSMTQINGYVNGAKTPVKHEQNPRHPVTPPNCPPPIRYQNERPHRSNSERSNKSPGENLNYIVGNNGILPAKIGLYRSNSSLDLEHTSEMLEERSGILRRDYGSASSLDLISATGESFFAMLREFRRENFDQRSPGPPKIQEFLKGKIDPTPSTQNAANALANGPESFEESNSPKIKNKFYKLWDIKDKTKAKNKLLSSEPSIFKKLRGSKTDMSDCTGKGSDNSLDTEARIEDKLRRKAFAHYDCESLVANLSYASRLRSLLSRRRNTTTGASAASMQNRSHANNLENMNPEDSDPGDGQSSELLLSCPFFRNELGGEEERVISLNRTTCKKQKVPDDAFGVSPTVHKPNLAYGVSVLEKSSGSRWSQRFCPYQRHPLQMEKTGAGALYYRLFFYGQEHQNWFGNDENLGPVAISIKREKLEHVDNSAKNSNGTVTHIQYRLIIRTSELSVMRGTVLEDAVPTIARSSQPRTSHVKEVIGYIAPELHLPCLRLANLSSQTEEHLLRLDEQGLTKTFKVGVMYCKAGQGTEEEMYNNEFAGPAFEEFLDMLGQRIRLKGFEKYRGGLDTKTDTTGLYSVFTTHQDCEVMFHVSTLLPYTPNNKQQLLRKRHIGNDIVTIVFQEPDALPFTPKNIRSQFQHVFVVVRVVNPCTDNACYRVAVSRSKEVAAFGPPIPAGALFPKSKKFADFLLAKVINAENAAHRSDKFVTMAQRTRQEYLKDLATNYCTNTTIDSGPKFSILSFGGRKKERSRPRFIPDNYVLGAISWQVQVEDFGRSTLVDSLLAVSVDTLVVMDETTQEIIFVCPCASILGWSSQTTSLKLFYHQGECLVIRSKDPDVDEIQEIVSRLQAVTEGAETQELILRRNSLGQLGFHVQFEGVITEVENYGFAWQAGLRQGSRLVEICKVAVATLSYDQMVDLLKTSMTVSVTVIPPLTSGTSRKGCNLHNCAYLSSGSIGDYENIGICDHGESHHKTTPRQQSAFHSQRISSKREDRHSNPQNSNRSPSMDRILPKSDVRNIFSESRRDHIQHHSILSLRNIQDSSQNVLPSRLAAYSGVSNLQSIEHESNPKSGTSFPTPRSSPVYLSSNSHDHGLPAYGNIQSHLHRSFHDRNRSGISQRLTHIGGMVSARSELSLTDINPFHMRTHSYQKGPLCQHSSKSQSPSENFTPLQSHQNPSSHSPSFKNNNAFVKRSPPSVNSDYHSDSSSDWHQGASSADELCDLKINASPHRFIQDSKSVPSVNPSKKISESTQSKLSRLRPGVTNCSTRPTKPTVNFVAIASSGSSCSGSTSTLQEDLLKLINPEYLDSDSNSEDPPSSHLDSDAGSRTHLSTPSSSLERSTGNTPDPALDVILTKAQPAHVIASEPSSPAASDLRFERLSPRVLPVQNKFKPLPPPPSSPSLISLSDNRDIDWTGLVSSATKGIEALPIGSASWLEEAEKQLCLESNTLGAAIPNVKELESRLLKMQQDLLKEQHQKANLENEVLQLREENQRLQAASQTAAVQIQKYKDWYSLQKAAHSQE
ncbi:signal-induced proliferation-associated 1-like protein 2 [Argiope bruennichi]|uniref:signal-induced proliferation-associated 1-like protein 2 n=1 Tax=Argiope bruennichi TaxID=94029 RepID=UPI002494F7DC|nr:signal-induced proliferation-associated 1-like protein 2 [Argiope bruennichi]XP_055945136.1 signal-induced proliferation-associated 1-like protein 2 [Argiope bruennichi]XP_055945137.1 signal-induced proliferation-associated 1-like protein 2 [Argiope bruennichi]